MPKCPDCQNQLSLTHFPFLRNGKRGRYCSDCRPPYTERAPDPKVVEASREFLIRRRETDLCRECQRPNWVYWYRPSDGQLCDVFKLVDEKGTAVWWLRRLLSQLHPYCDGCKPDGPQVNTRVRLRKAAEAAKARALKASSKAKKHQYWRQYFYLSQQLRVAAAGETLAPGIDAELDELMKEQ